MNSRIMYLRDSNWNPIGCVIIKVDRAHRRAQYNFAVLNPKDKDPRTNRPMKFDRHESQRLAMARMIESPITVVIPKDATQHDISMAVMTDISESEAPSRAIKFAKAWVNAAVRWYVVDVPHSQFNREFE